MKNISYYVFTSSSSYLKSRLTLLHNATESTSKHYVPYPNARVDLPHDTIRFVDKRPHRLPQNTIPPYFLTR